MGILDEALGGKKSILDEALDAPKEKSLMERIVERYSKVPVSAGDLVTGRTPFVATGQTIGAVGDIATTGIGKLLNAVTPDIVKDEAKEIGRSLANSQTGKLLLGTAGDLAGKYDKTFSPNQKEFLENAFNIASVLPVGKGAELTGKGLSAVAKSEPVKLASDIAKIGAETVRTIKPTDIADQVKIKKIVKDSFERSGVKPKDAVAADKFYTLGSEAVPDIIKFAPESIAKSERPLETAIAAMENAKKNIFAQADALTKQAGMNGMPNNAQLKAINELLDPAGDKFTVLRDHRPELYKDLVSLKEALEGNVPKSATQMQAEIAHYNSIAGNREKFSNIDRQINGALAGAIRQDLETGLQSLGIEGRNELMRRYGAIKEVESQLARVAVSAYGKKNLSYLDVLSVGSGVSGLVTANPSLLLMATTTAGTLHGLKRLKSPERILKNMFKDVEKIQARKEFADKLRSHYMKQQVNNINNMGY